MKTFRFFDKNLQLTDEIRACLEVYGAYASLNPIQARAMDRHGERTSDAILELQEAIYDEYFDDLEDLTDELYDEYVERLDEAWDAQQVIDALFEIVDSE